MCSTHDGVDKRAEADRVGLWVCSQPFSKLLWKPWVLIMLMASELAEAGIYLVNDTVDGLRENLRDGVHATR